MIINIKSGDVITFYVDGYKVTHTKDIINFYIINKSENILRVTQGKNLLLILKSKRGWFGDYEIFTYNKDNTCDTLTYKTYKDEEIKVGKEKIKTKLI